MLLVLPLWWCDNFAGDSDNREIKDHTNTSYKIKHEFRGLNMHHLAPVVFMIYYSVFIYWFRGFVASGDLAHHRRATPDHISSRQ